MIVIDASAFLEVLLRSTSGLAVEALLEDTMAPDLLDAEHLLQDVRQQPLGLVARRGVGGLEVRARVQRAGRL